VRAETRTTTQRLLKVVQRPDVYREVVIRSAGAPVVLSVWNGSPGLPAVLFLPGTMTHPLFHEEFLDALARARVTAVGVHAQGHGNSPRVRRPRKPALTVEHGGRRVRGWGRARRSSPYAEASWELLPSPWGTERMACSRWWL
jgi:hypothetical protein